MVNSGKLESLSELRTYVAVVEEGSLVAAGRSLGVSANAVSRRLSILEGRLGRRLIHRTTRKLSISDEGRAFYDRCRRVLDELVQAERELAGDCDMTRTLRVGMHTGLLSDTLISAICELLKEAPQIRMQLRVSNQFVDPIGAGLDLSIYIGKPPASSLVAVALGHLEWSLFAAPSYLQAHGQPAGPEELGQHECLRILRDEQETHWRLKRAKGRPRRFAIGGRFETTDGTALAHALYAGFGIGVQLRSAARSKVRAKQLVPVLPEWQWDATPLYALLPKGRTKVPAVRVLLDVLKKATTQLS